MVCYISLSCRNQSAKMSLVVSNEDLYQISLNPTRHLRGHFQCLSETHILRLKLEGDFAMVVQEKMNPDTITLISNPIQKKINQLHTATVYKKNHKQYRDTKNKKANIFRQSAILKQRLLPDRKYSFEMLF